MGAINERIAEFCELNDIFVYVDWDLLIVKFAKCYSDGTYEKVEARLPDCNEHPDDIRLHLIRKFWKG